MDFLKKLPEFVSKYRWAVLILVLGVVLMVMPTGEKQEQPVETSPAAEEADLTEQLQTILGQIKGVGRVQVLLTVETGTNTVYRTDGEDTVIVTDGNRNQQGLVERVESPQYRGAVIVCQGADSPSVRLGIVEAVRTITGLGSDRITVLKMK